MGCDPGFVLLSQDSGQYRQIDDDDKTHRTEALLPRIKDCLSHIENTNFWLHYVQASWLPEAPSGHSKQSFHSPHFLAEPQNHDRTTLHFLLTTTFMPTDASFHALLPSVTSIRASTGRDYNGKRGRGNSRAEIRI